MGEVYVKVKDLPNAIRNALARVEYGRSDIAVEGREQTNVRPTGGDGYRGFAIAVALDGSGTIVERWGSWGGANPFTRTIDDASESIDLMPHTVIIRGRIGGGQPTYARILAHPSALAPLLPKVAEVSLKDLMILHAISTYKSGPYRAEALREARATDADLDVLADRGLVKRAKNGATSITTEGRNALTPWVSAGVTPDWKKIAEKLNAARG